MSPPTPRHWRSAQDSRVLPSPCKRGQCLLSCCRQRPRGNVIKLYLNYSFYFGPFSNLKQALYLIKVQSLTILKGWVQGWRVLHQLVLILLGIYSTLHSIPLSNQNVNDFGESVGVVNLKSWRELGLDVAMCWCKILVLAACNLPLLSCRILPAVTPAAASVVHLATEIRGTLLQAAACSYCREYNVDASGSIQNIKVLTNCWLLSVIVEAIKVYFLFRQFHFKIIDLLSTIYIH